MGSSLHHQRYAQTKSLALFSLLIVCALELQSDEPKVLSRAEDFASRIRAGNGAPMDVSDCFLYLSIDFMGDLAFNKDLGMNSGSQGKNPLKLLRDGMHILGPLTPIPWLAQLAFSLPGAAAAWMSLINWCMEVMEERPECDLKKPDVRTLRSPLQRTGMN